MIRPPLTGRIYVEVAFSICQSLEPGLSLRLFFGTSVLPQSSIDDADAGVALTIALDERVKGSGIRGVQPDAAMRSRRAEAAHILGPMNGVTAIEEHRVRHRRVVIFARIMHPLQIFRTEAAARRIIAPFGGRHLPDRIGPAIDLHIHSLS